MIDNEFYKEAIETIKTHTMKYGDLMPMVYAEGSMGVMWLGLPWRNETEKSIMKKGLRIVFDVFRVKRYIWASEAWIKPGVTEEEQRAHRAGKSLSEMPGHKEIVWAIFISYEERKFTWFEMIRDENGKLINLGPAVVSGNEYKNLSGDMAEFLPGEQKIASLEEKRIAKAFVKAYKLRPL